MNIDEIIDITAKELYKDILETIVASRSLQEENKSPVLKQIIVDKLNAFKNKVAEDQFEKDCDAACDECCLGNIPVKEENEWKHHLEESRYPVICLASEIRNRRASETRIMN